MTLADRLRKLAEFDEPDFIDWCIKSKNIKFSDSAKYENARLKPALLEAAKLVEALEWIANFEEDSLDLSRTLHYDMNGKAKEVLSTFDQALKDMEGA